MKTFPKTGFKISYIATAGGEDLITPALHVKPGEAMLTRNYELDQFGRYRRLDGYEAFDGQPQPSQASYWVMGFDAGSVEIVATDEIEGSVSGATGYVLDVILSDGAWADGDAEGTIVFTYLDDTFQDNENIEVLGGVVAVVDGVAAERGAAEEDDPTYLIEAIEYARDQIAAVPGAGAVLGVWSFNGVKYAFRNNALATAGIMHRSSATGWQVCDLGATLDFTAGLSEIEEGNTITGDVSGETAVVRRIIVTSGTWADGDAAGRLIIYTPSGDFQAEAISVGGVVSATIAANFDDNSLPPSGRYEFVNYNFGGHAGTRRMYGCNGVGNAFEWDGTVFTPILSGMADDKPTHITAHKNHLFLMFPGGSVQHSSIGAPYEWSAITGAGEIGIGDEGTGFISVPNLLAIMSRNSTKILYGSGAESWSLATHSDESGAIEWTLQGIGAGIYLDDRGLTSLTATDQYGDFKTNTISKAVDPYLKTVMALTQSSIRVKEKNQYRLFFTDGSGLFLTLSGSDVVGYTRVLYDHVPMCCCSAEDATGSEELFFGSSNGVVYQMDSGNTFNGDAIEALIMFHFNNLKTPSIKKRIRKMTLVVDSPIGTRISAGIEFDYGDTGNPGYSLVADGKGGIWGVDKWESFVWDGKSDSSIPIHIDGTGTNFGLSIYYSGEHDGQVLNAGPHTLQGYIVHYDERGVQR